MFPYGWGPLEFLNLRLAALNFQKLAKHSLKFPLPCCFLCGLPFFLCSFKPGLPIFTSLPTLGVEVCPVSSFLFSIQEEFFFLSLLRFSLVRTEWQCLSSSHVTRNRVSSFSHLITTYSVSTTKKTIWDLGPQRKSNLCMQGMWTIIKAIIRSLLKH